MTNLPIIKQIADIFGLMLRGTYLLYDYFGVQNITLCIITVVVVIKMALTLSSIKANLLRFLAPKLLPYTNTIYKKYENKLADNPLCKTKCNADKHIFLTQYCAIAKSGCLRTIITLCIIFALYGIINAPVQYIPELAELSKQEMTHLNSFFGIDIMSIPGYKIGVNMIFPIAVAVTNLLQTLLNAEVSKVANGGKVQGGIMNAITLAMMFYFSATFPIILSIYWIANSVIDIVQIAFIKVYVNKTPLEKIKANRFKSINKLRRKRGLPNTNSYCEIAPTLEMPNQNMHFSVLQESLLKQKQANAQKATSPQ